MATRVTNADGDVTVSSADEATIADAAWDELRAGHNTSSTFGETVTSLQARLPGSGTLAVAGDEMSLTEAMEAELVDSVWDEATSGHPTAGTTGKALSDVASAATEARLAELDAANVPADIDTLKTRIPGTVQPQTGDSYARLGAPAGASISADIANVQSAVTTILAAVDTEVAAIKAKTDNLPASPAAQTKLDTLHDTRIPDVLSLANVNAEVDTALNTAIPATNTADSVNDVLLDQLKPRLPGSGTLAVAGDEMSLTEAMEAELVDSAWDEALSGHPTAGTTGKALSDLDTRLTAARAANLDAPLTTAATFTHTAAGGTGDQEVTAVTTAKGLIQVVLNLSALTEDVTVKTSVRVGGAWVLAKSELVPDPGANAVKAWYSDPLIGGAGVRVQLASSVAEAADRSVPYELNRLLGA